MLANTHHDDSQIVFSATLVATLFQLIAKFFEIVADDHELPNLVVGNVTGDAVSAQQKLGAVLNLHRLHVDFDALLRTERTTDHVLAGMIRGLLGRHSSRAHFFFDDRMIFSFAMQLVRQA